MTSTNDHPYDRRKSLNGTSAAATSPSSPHTRRNNKAADVGSSSPPSARTGPAEPNDGSQGVEQSCETNPDHSYLMPVPACPPCTPEADSTMTSTPALTDEAVRFDILNFIKETMEPEGDLVSACYVHATETPPITQQSLAELDMSRIINNPKLRHDVNFDRELHFRPNLDGSKGREKMKQADEYWKALEGEFFLYSYILTRRMQPDEASNVSYWDRVMKSSQQRLPAVFTAICDILTTLVPDCDQQKINDRLDKELIMQQIERGMCDYVDLADWLALVLKNHCAPMRDVWVDEMQTAIRDGAMENDLAVLVTGLRKLLQILEAMKLDVANHQIRHMRPLLVEDTINFQKRYNAHRIGLKKISVQAAQEWLGRGTMQSDGQFSSPSIRSLTSALFRDLIYASSSSYVPPTFYLDAERLKALRVELHSDIYLSICSDLFTMMAKDQINPPVDLAEINKAAHTLRAQIKAIVGNSTRFGDRIENIAIEIVRSLATLEGRFPSVAERVDESRVNFAELELLKSLHLKSVPFGVHARALMKRLLPKLLRSVEKHQRLSAMDLQDALLPPSTSSSGNSASGSSALKFGAILEPMHASKTLDPDVDIVNRFTHMLVLHWQVWADLAYLTPCPSLYDGSSSSDNDEVSSNGDDFNHATSATPSPRMPVAQAIFSEDRKFLPDKIVMNDAPPPARSVSVTVSAAMLTPATSLTSSPEPEPMRELQFEDEQQQKQQTFISLGSRPQHNRASSSAQSHAQSEPEQQTQQQQQQRGFDHHEHAPKEQHHSSG